MAQQWRSAECLAGPRLIPSDLAALDLPGRFRFPAVRLLASDAGGPSDGCRTADASRSADTSRSADAFRPADTSRSADAFRPASTLPIARARRAASRTRATAPAGVRQSAT